MNTHELYMHRCLQLAQLAQGNVAPNPMVGAVLVHHQQIIGEGYHQQYGLAHAEVNCIASVKAEHHHLISDAVLYVSLEPCAHFGKTPPCADLIVGKNIRKVVVGCRDPFAQVDGRGIEKLKAAGIEVEMNILKKECTALNKRFFTFHKQHRPYIVLKWAQTSDGKMASQDKSRLLISNEYTNRLVHKWRSEEQAIMIGTNTALFDDPELTTRLWPGTNPLRLVVDKDLRLPSSLKLFNENFKTIVFNLHKHKEGEKLSFYQIAEDANVVHQIINALHSLKIQSVLVEGGTQLLQSFIEEGLWDEARVIVNEELILGSGLAAPALNTHAFVSSNKLQTDTIHFYTNKKRPIF